MHNMLDLLLLDGMCHAESMTPFLRATTVGRPYIILLFILFIGCSDTTPTTDMDGDFDSSLSTDRDSDLSTVDTDLLFTDRDNDLSTHHDSDVSDDSDIVCLDLRISENVIKTPFPFKDKDGKPTFCRPGCDTPTETDPQCVRNIWEWDNWG
ncbi:hypothetical protein KAH37_08850, partial [bacterium]|nr:hypothetical protein [bacterium]